MHSQIAWLTDPHLDMVSEEGLALLIQSIADQAVSALVITGDIAEADSLLPTLQAMDEGLAFPIYFVLGNHDYYGSSIEEVRNRVRHWSASSRHTHWLPSRGSVSLSPETILVGHGGWGDGGYGDFLASNVRLNDYRRIDDLVEKSGPELKHTLHSLGEEAADCLEKQILQAWRKCAHVLVATHVPPFVEACWYQGTATLNEWTPHFSCAAVGHRLRSLALSNQDKRMTVLCGHTHSAGVAQIMPNLRVLTGKAEYGMPSLQPHVTIP